MNHQPIGNSGNHSISAGLLRLRVGDTSAANEICSRYFEHVVRLIEKKLHSRRVMDGDDVANQVFANLLAGIAKNSFIRLNDRNDLWQILIVLSKRRTVESLRYLKAIKRGDVRGESVFESLEAETGGRTLEDFADQPTDSDADALRQEVRDLLEFLVPRPELHRLATLLLEGNSQVAIARELGVATKTIQRRLRLIQTMWLEEKKDE